MDIPLPGAGNSFLQGLSGANALNKQMMENLYYGPTQQSEVDYRNALAKKEMIDNLTRNAKNQLNLKQLQQNYDWGPAMKAAGINSKNTYADIAGRQVVAKALGLPDVVANSNDPELKRSSNYVLGSGNGHPQQTGNLQEGISLADLARYLQQHEPNHAIPGLPSQAPSSGQQVFPLAEQQSSPNGRTGNEQVELPPLPSLKGTNNTVSQKQFVPSTKTYAEKTADYKGVLKEGEELGGLRAKSIDDMDKQYEQALAADIPIDHFIEMTHNPIFENMRKNVPFFQDKQLSALSAIGTPQEQKIVGDFVTSGSKAVANTINSFRGRILDKEIDLANNMKISPKDTWNVMLGKLESIKTFNEITKQRARIASQLMQKDHINRGDALEQADKQVDGEKIRNKIQEQLTPQPNDADIKYMAKKYNKTEEQIKQDLKKKGFYNG